MTLQSSGSMTGAQIRNELRQSGGNLVFPDATTRWLANKPVGNLVIPTDFYSKQAVKMVEERHMVGGGTVYSVTANYGPDFPGRALVVCACGIATATGSGISVTGISLSGVGLYLGPGQAWYNPSISITSGIAYPTTPSAITGTSGTLTLTFNQSMSVVHTVIYSISNRGLSGTFNQNGGLSDVSVVGTLSSVPANAVGIQSALKTDALGNTFTFFGTNKITDSAIGGNVIYATGTANRLPASGAYNFGFTINGGTSPAIVTSAMVVWGG